MSKLAEALLEWHYPGRLLSATKTAPPGEVVFWNACIFDANERQVWHGDVNLTTESAVLQAIAILTKEKFYVTREMPFRFEGLKKGRRKALKDSVMEFNP